MLATPEMCYLCFDAIRGELEGVEALKFENIPNEA
jgi:hypothetical protein